MTVLAERARAADGVASGGLRFAVHGAGRPLRLGHSFRQALYLWAALVVLGMAILLNPGVLLDWAEVPPTLRAEVLDYLGVLALALPMALMFRLYSTLNQSLGKPQLVTWLQLGSLCLKVPLSVWFAFGGAGVPALGAVGCAWATLLVHGSMLALALWLLRPADETPANKTLALELADLLRLLFKQTAHLFQG